MYVFLISLHQTCIANDVFGKDMLKYTCSAASGMNNIISRNLLLIRLKDCWTASLSLGDKMSIWTNQEICEKRVCSPCTTLKRDIPIYPKDYLISCYLQNKRPKGHITYLIHFFFTTYKPMFIPA